MSKRMFWINLIAALLGSAVGFMLYEKSEFVSIAGFVGIYTFVLIVGYAITKPTENNE